MGIFYSVAGEYDTHLLWNDNMLPICPNMIGGILLYSEALTEDADNIYPSTNKLPVAHASNDVNATADVARGSMNLTESKPLEKVSDLCGSLHQVRGMEPLLRWH